MRLIDADALKLDLIAKGFLPAIVKRAIDNAPTIESEHGRWEFVDDYTGRCTNCKEENLMDWECEDKVCPNCGAKMDLEVSK